MKRERARVPAVRVARGLERQHRGRRSARAARTPAAITAASRRTARPPPARREQPAERGPVLGLDRHRRHQSRSALRLTRRSRTALRGRGASRRRRRPSSACARRPAARRSRAVTTSASCSWCGHPTIATKSHSPGHRVRLGDALDVRQLPAERRERVRSASIRTTALVMVTGSACFTGAMLTAALTAQPADSAMLARPRPARQPDQRRRSPPPASSPPDARTGSPAAAPRTRPRRAGRLRSTRPGARARRSGAAQAASSASAPALRAAEERDRVDRVGRPARRARRRRGTARARTPGRGGARAASRRAPIASSVDERVDAPPPPSK